LSVIRVSGESLSNLFFQLTDKKQPKPNHVYLVELLDPRDSSHMLDQVLVTYFKAPQSYTGEDCIEISCHGGKLIAANILTTLFKSGLREASPGEFSYRAFINGKIDLIQAEAISSIVSSKTEFDLLSGFKGLTGNSSLVLREMQESIKSLLMFVENELDFTEDNTSNFRNSLIENIKRISDKLTFLINSTLAHNKLKEGIRIVLVGKPNSGKSSLFNYLIGENRAIVSDIAGTTRDTLESWHEIEGVSVCFVDTAGVWESDDFLENLGIEKAYDEMLKADLLLILDVVDPFCVFKSVEEHINVENVVFIQTKSDLYDTGQHSGTCYALSVKTQKGVEFVLDAIKKFIVERQGVLPENYFYTTHRQQLILNNVSADFLNLINDFPNMELDMVSSALWNIVDTYSSLFGDNNPENVINNIFSNFCIGK
jgi:tRNA modification GTPase